jgi:ribosomal 30S subunit maturation factor RimM
MVKKKSAVKKTTSVAEASTTATGTTTTNTTVKKKTVAKKKAVATTKKTTAIKAAVASNEKIALITAEQRYQLISETAYYLSLMHNGSGEDSSVDDWLQAERSIDEMYRVADL